MPQTAVPPIEELAKIDAHVHLFEDIPAMAAGMQRLNIPAINVCYGGTDPNHLKEQEEICENLYRRYFPLFPFASTFDLTDCEAPDYPDRIISWLDKTFDAGAVMVKVWKDVGMIIRSKDGNFIFPDDPIFDPIYEHIARQDRTLMIHAADLYTAWSRIPSDNPFCVYFEKNPQCYPFMMEEAPRHETIIQARDHILRKYPKLRVVGAHLGSLCHDLDALAERFDAFPNFWVDVSARTVVLSRHNPQKVREFFNRYAERILYGTDVTPIPPENIAVEPPLDKYLPWVTWSERMYRTEYQYYSGTGTVEYWDRPVECLNLSPALIERFYCSNALSAIPGIATSISPR